MKLHQFSFLCIALILLNLVINLKHDYVLDLAYKVKCLLQIHYPSNQVCAKFPLVLLIFQKKFYLDFHDLS